MAEFTDFLEQELLDHVFAGASYTPPASIHLALYTTVNSDSTPGTEVTGSGYARQETAFTPGTNPIVNAAIESFTASGGNYGTVVSTALMDAATVGNQLCFDNDFTDTVVNDGNTLEFAAGAITVALD